MESPNTPSDLGLVQMTPIKLHFELDHIWFNVHTLLIFLNILRARLEDFGEILGFPSDAYKGRTSVEEGL